MNRIFQDDLLCRKTAFVTGGSSGIGLGIAEMFVALGASVVLLGRNREKVDLAVASIRASGGTAAGYAADVRDAIALNEAFSAARTEFGELDILVCAAAGNFVASAVSMSPNGFRAVIDIDLIGTYNACRAAYPHLRKPGACVLNITANHARLAYAYQSHVCSAKAGIEMLARVLALEWAADGIRVNSLSPGPIDGTEGMRRLAPTEEMRRAAAASVPLGRFGRCEDVAALAAFLCSGAASFVTGATFVCDGGQSLLGPRRLAGAAEAVR